MITTFSLNNAVVQFLVYTIVNSSRHLWFQPSLTKTQAADILCTSRPRSFIVRESQKEPGAYAITARAPEELVRRSQNPPIPPGT